MCYFIDNIEAYLGPLHDLGEMDLFETLINSFQLLTNVKKNPILDVVEVLDPLLQCLFDLYCYFNVGLSFPSLYLLTFSRTCLL